MKTLPARDRSRNFIEIGSIPRWDKSRIPLYSSLLPSSVYEVIKEGRVAVIRDFLSPDEVSILRKDAQTLWKSNYFSTDALASYGTSGKFDPSKDRAVLRLNRWKDTSIGDWKSRKVLGQKMALIRSELSINLNRARLDNGHAVKDYGEGSTEISYTRFGPGAFLKRHIDEHHEELKGIDGWKKPTRRSVTWLIYLNEDDWDVKQHGGELRVFERRTRTAAEVGSRSNGDLQIGWLRPSSTDPIERPVFLDGLCINEDKTGHCAMYIDDPTKNGRIKYITKSFDSHPFLFSAGSEQLTKSILIRDPDLAARFHFLEVPKSAIDAVLFSKDTPTGTNPSHDELSLNIPPEGGSLVLFDSVTVPHEVLATKERERWAASGWFHEDQQQVPLHMIT